MLTTAEMIRVFRHRRGWTQRDLAEAAGVTQATIFRLERGSTNPNINTLRKVAAALEVPLSEILMEGAAPAGVS